MVKKSLLIMLLMAVFAPWAAAQKELPYEYGFENNNLAEEGWTLQNCKTGTGIVSSTSYGSPHTGTYYFQFQYQANSNQWLVSPELQTSTKNIVLEFYYRKYTSGTESFKVGYSTTTTDADQFTFGEVITCTNTTYPAEPNYSNTFPAGTKYIAIAYVANDQWYFNIDDIHIEEESDCPKPIELTATNVTNNSATLGWTSNADSWNLQYKAASDADWTLVSGITNPYTLNGVLSEKTTYTFQVQPVCSGTPGNYSNTATFTTTCNPKNLTYTMGFEASEATEFTDWTVVSNSSSTGRNTSAKKTGNYGFQFIYNTSAQYLITPPFNATTGVHIEFYYKNSTSSYTATTFKVGYSTTTNETSAFTWEESTTASASWELYSKTFNADVKYIAIQYEPVASGNYRYLYIDDIILEAPAACEKPSGMTATANAEDPVHKADLTWTAGGDETSWDIIYNANADFDPSTEGTLVANVSNNPYTLEGLTGGVTYYAYVRGHCPNGSDVSNWSTVACQFNTQNGCNTPTSLTATAIPGGFNLTWEDGGNTVGSWQVAYSTSYNPTPPANSTIVDVTTNPYSLTGLGYGTYYYIWVRTICENNDGTSSWSSYQYKQTLVQFPAPTIASTSATPDGAVVTWNKGYEETKWQIKYRKQSYGSEETIVDEIIEQQNYTLTGLDASTAYYVYVRAYIDADHQSAWSSSGSFTTLATCPKPTNLTYSDLTANSVVLDWTIGYDETAWHIQYKANGADDWTLIEYVADKPYTMTVDDATTYQVQIRNACGSDWSNTITFTTPCLPNSTFPFEEDFNDLTVANSIPSCWDNADGTTTTASYKWCYNTSTSGNGATNGTSHDGSKCVRFESYNNSNNNTNFLKTPVMNFPAGKTMVLGFWWKNPAGGDFSVYISTDGGATYTTALKSGMTGQTTWKEEEIELTGYVGTQNVVIVFKGTSNSAPYGADGYIYLDDVTISEKSDCAKPKDLAVSSFDNHSATLSWDANGSEGPWQVAYSTTENFNLDDPTAYSVEEATTNPFTLSGLTNFTTYYVRVRTKCGESTYSDWNNNGYQTFTTTATYTAPTNVTFSNVGDTEATISWTKGNSEEDNTDYTVWYKTGDTELTQDVENATSVTLTNLNAGSNYEVKVRAKKGDDFSAWSSSVEFQTAFCAIGNQCEISYTLTDSWGDGWNGDAAINVVYKSTNVVVASLKIPYVSGSRDQLEINGTLALCDGFEYDFVWVYGSSFDSECGFTFTNVNNEVIYASNGTPSAGTVFSYEMDCTIETCARPSGLTVNAVHPYSAELSWTNGDDTQAAWQIAYSTSTFNPNAENFDLSTVNVEEVSTNPFTLGILDANTHYYTYVRAVCGDNDFSKWSADVCEFTTQAACPAPTNVHLVSRPASNQLAIGWTPGYEETDWNFYYKVAGTEWGDPIAVTSPAYTIVDGELSTAYEVKVAAVCGDEEGGVSDIATFSTPINVTVNAPFSEGFNQSGCPIGWTAVSGVYNNYTYHWTFGGTLASSERYSEMYLVTPLLHLTDLTPILSFAQKRAGNYSSSNIAVKISTTGTATADFTETIWSGTTGELTTSNKTTTVDLSEFVNQDVYIAFFYNGIGGHYWHIDDVNVTIGNTFRTAGNWNVADNWSEKVPTSDDNAIIAAAATVPSGVVATANNITVAEGGSLTIADGGQLVHNNAGVQATVQKVINAHGETTADGGWYFIASPISTAVNPSVAGLITDDLGSDVTSATATYDLYYFYENPGNELEWKNYRNTTFNLYNKDGYLYANKAKVTLNFTGSINPATSSMPQTLDFTEGVELAGWNLVGNPFTFNTYVNMSYYKMNDDGSAIEPEAVSQTTTIAPCTGIMVQATATGQSITFSKDAPSSQNGNQGNLNIALVQANVRNNAVMDKAILSFNEGSQLSKFYFGQSKANIYFPQFNEELAIVQSEGMGEMPLSFRANESGTYTLSFNAEEVTFSYLHLIDNMTGMDVDLLQTPSYTFDARTTDYSSRFRLVFATGSNNDSDNFAFFSNGTWVISNDGEATLQVIDVTGRVLCSETVNGSVSKAINASAGVYMLRLINGNDVRTQKIVVR